MRSDRPARISRSMIRASTKWIAHAALALAAPCGHHRSSGVAAGPRRYGWSFKLDISGVEQDEDLGCSNCAGKARRFGPGPSLRTRATLLGGSKPGPATSELGCETPGRNGHGEGPCGLA
jgi:hypothetical protein